MKTRSNISLTEKSATPTCVVGTYTTWRISLAGIMFLVLEEQLFEISLWRSLYLSRWLDVVQYHSIVAMAIMFQIKTSSNITPTEKTYSPTWAVETFTMRRILLSGIMLLVPEERLFKTSLWKLLYVSRWLDLVQYVSIASMLMMFHTMPY